VTQKTLFRPHLYMEDMAFAIEALRDRGTETALAIAKDWQIELDHHVRDREVDREAEEAISELRRQRAADAVLTKRQAQMLAALRLGKSPREVWHVGDNVAGGWWRSTRTMGGAVWRLRTALVEEGLVEEKKWACTPEGLARLEAWEKAHPKIIIGPKEEK
jgi:hypothetical protein